MVFLGGEVVSSQQGTPATPLPAPMPALFSASFSAPLVGTFSARFRAPPLYASSPLFSLLSLAPPFPRAPPPLTPSPRIGVLSHSPSELSPSPAENSPSRKPSTEFHVLRPVKVLSGG